MRQLSEAQTQRGAEGCAAQSPDVWPPCDQVMELWTTRREGALIKSSTKPEKAEQAT